MTIIKNSVRRKVEFLKKEIQDDDNKKKEISK
jgi:hypothetical protein